jgi:predicted GNAT superfamily acetyltransferase
MKVCVGLQQQVWGYAPIDTVPDQIFIVANKTGGHVLVAYEQEQPIGFALAFAAVRDGQTYLHSHMVAVVEEFQNRGVGRLLKLAQRDDAIARGFDLVEWTFDPLQLKNAHFNLARLGAIVRRYIPNLYGRTSSPLHAGLPTDRLVAEWWVKSRRVEDIISGHSLKPSKAAERVAIPAAIRELCVDNPSAAEDIQSGAREQFSRHFAAGLAAVAFEWEQDQGNYVLERYED